MKYYKDVDYFLYFENFPHMGIPGAIALNSDDTVNIFINTLYNTAVQARTVRHELRHMAYGHFHSDWMTITEKEVEADNEDDPNCIFDDDFAWVEYTGAERLPPQSETYISRKAIFREIDACCREAGIYHMNLSMPSGTFLPKKDSERMCADVENVCAMIKIERENRQTNKKSACVPKNVRR